MQIGSKSAPDVVVVGGGAAGIIAAWRAASIGAKTVLLEKTERLGTKILISGGGKCNITHDGEIEEVLRAFRKNEAAFLRPSFYRFTNAEIVGMLTSRGLKVYTRPDNRIFPSGGTAKDVMRILSDLLHEAKVKVEMRTRVRGISATDGFVAGVVLETGVLNCNRVIVATGGSSYPKSGTTGDAWGWVKRLGHSIVPIRAALAPIYLGVDGMEARAGVAIRDCLLKARQTGKEIARWRGDVLFTHRGVSGPTVLGISRDVAERAMLGPISLEVDILPDSSFEQTTERLVEYSTLHPRRSIGTFIAELMPEALVRSALDSISLDPVRSLASLSRKERSRIVELIKGWTLGDVRSVPLEKGECVAGGVALDEVDQKSMRSTIVRGLYLCGEALDIAGPVGGYNLQAAFSTGYVAGDTAAHDAMAQGK